MNLIFGHDRLSDIVESLVQWRSDFQNGYRVLKGCYGIFLIYIFGIQCDFCQKFTKNTKILKIADFAL